MILFAESLSCAQWFSVAWGQATVQVWGDLISRKLFMNLVVRSALNCPRIHALLVYFLLIIIFY